MHYIRPEKNLGFSFLLTIGQNHSLELVNIKSPNGTLLAGLRGGAGNSLAQSRTLLLTSVAVLLRTEPSIAFHIFNPKISFLVALAAGLVARDVEIVNFVNGSSGNSRSRDLGAFVGCVQLHIVRNPLEKGQVCVPVFHGRNRLLHRACPAVCFANLGLVAVADVDLEVGGVGEHVVLQAKTLARSRHAAVQLAQGNQNGPLLIVLKRHFAIPALSGSDAIGAGFAGHVLLVRRTLLEGKSFSARHNGL